MLQPIARKIKKIQKLNGKIEGSLSSHPDSKQPPLNPSIVIVRRDALD
jgi:hypothetical protein